LLLRIVLQVALWIIERFFRLNFATDIVCDIFNIGAKLFVEMKAKNIRVYTHFLAVTYSSLYTILFLLLAYTELLGTYFVFFDAVGFMLPTLLVLARKKEHGAAYAAIFFACASALCNVICLIIIGVDWGSKGAGYLNMNNVTGLFSALIVVIAAQAIFLILSIFAVYLLVQMILISKEKNS